MNSLTTTDRLKELLPQLFNQQRLQGNYYLRFQLTNEISGLIDLKYVQESLTILGDRITAIPNLPEYVIGLMSSRNQVFLALDLAHLAGLTPETVNLRQYQVIVIQKADISKAEDDSPEINLFGLAVKKIEGITRILPESLMSITDLESIPASLRPFIKSSVLEINNQTGQNTAEKSSLLIDISQLIVHRVNS